MIRMALVIVMGTCIGGLMACGWIQNPLVDLLVSWIAR